jgi:SAM-dependent methyltransferase
MTLAYDWAGRVGETWADEWRRTDLSFSGLSPHLDAAILAVAPNTGSAVDIGCGAGGTSIALATARPGLSVVGIDLSRNLVDTARGRAAGIPNLRFEVGDATELGGVAADLLFSRHGVMFFDDPVVAFTRLRRAAAADVRLVFSCFRDVMLNPWATESVAAVTGIAPQVPGTSPGPFAFAEADHVRAILDASGWAGEAQPVDYSYRAGEGPDPVADALAFFSRIGPAAAQLRELDDAARDAARERLRDALAMRLRNDAVDFPGAAWIWSCRPA